MQTNKMSKNKSILRINKNNLLNNKKKALPKIFYKILFNKQKILKIIKIKTKIKKYQN